MTHIVTENFITISMSSCCDSRARADCDKPAQEFFFFTGALTENTCHKRRHAASWGNVVENSDGFRQNSEIVMKFP